MSRDADGGLLLLMPAAGIAAFRRALRYALVAAGTVTPELMPRPTPCRGWDLRMLLLHTTDSLAALAEGLNDGRVLLDAEAGDAWAADAWAADADTCSADAGVLFRRQARRLLASSARADLADGVITVGGCPMAAAVLVTAGALEIAVHGWDIAQACGSREPIPAPLAAGLLRAAPLLITDADRRRLFDPPVRVTAAAGPSDRLTAFLGRPGS
jgi:uncharacterized protein (TIGR03086 family)